MAHAATTVIETGALLIGPYTVEFAFGSSSRLDEYRLRYRLFVEEHHWLNGDEESIEHDEYDVASCAFLLRDRRSGQPAACQRLILPDHLPAGLCTNVERFTPGFTRECGNLPSSSWAEVSRTSVAREFRFGARTAELPAMKAIKYASIALAVAFERHALFSCSDQRTARLIRRLGFDMHQIGLPFDFHGERVSYRIDMTEVRHSVPSEMCGPLDELIDAAVAFRKKAETH